MGVFSKLKQMSESAAVATYGNFALYRNGEIQKYFGEDAGRYSLKGATVDLDEGSALESRFTATRIFAIGVFALAFKKKKGGEKFLVIFGDDFQWIEEVPRKKVAEATKFKHQVQAAIQRLG